MWWELCRLADALLKDCFSGDSIHCPHRWEWETFQEDGFVYKCHYCGQYKKESIQDFLKRTNTLSYKLKMKVCPIENIISRGGRK